MKPVERGRSPPLNPVVRGGDREMDTTAIFLLATTIVGAIEKTASAIKAIAEAVLANNERKTAQEPRRGKHAKDTATNSKLSK